MTKHSRLRATTSISHPTDDPQAQHLLQSIEVACEDCQGVVQYHIIGHHIPALLKILQTTLERYPQFCQETVTEIPQGATLVIPPAGGRMM